MYNNPYEEYMRNSLGYNQMPSMNMNMNQCNYMDEMYETEGNFMCNQGSIEDMYPEIYRIIYPMICKTCMAVNENVTEDLVSRITNEVYMNVENMEVMQENRSSVNTINTQANKSAKNDSLNRTNSSNNSSNTLSNVRQQETRQRNPLLRDLIRILVLRELIGNLSRPRPRPRPPFRPPFGGGFGPGPRPPYMF